MSDQLDELHTQAGIARLQADSTLVVVADTPIGVNQAPPYVRVYVHIERPADHHGNKLSGTSDAYVVRWYCHCVGANDTSSRAVAMRVRSALLDYRPTITGRDCGLIRMESSVPPQRDESTGVMVIDTLQIFTMSSTG